jgi:hypothetical protein
MTYLSIEVIGPDVVVRKPGTALSITYRRVGNQPLLEAVDLMRDDPSPEEASFLVQAWKAAHARAQKLGWFRR